MVDILSPTQYVNPSGAETEIPRGDYVADALAHSVTRVSASMILIVKDEVFHVCYE